MVPPDADAATTPTPARESRVRVPSAPDRLVVVFSDIEMGAGGPFDDFVRSDFLGELIRSYAGARTDGLALELVFNGDTFDLLKTSYDGAWPRHITEPIALAKMARVAEAHPAFFDAVRVVLARLGERARVHFVVGNHDAELLFPAVQAFLRERLGVRGGPDSRVTFPGYALDIGRVRIEHGSQHDPLFRMDEARPFLAHGDAQLLNLPWASVALLDVAIPLQPLLYHHDRLKPKRVVLELMPEVRELLVGAFWRYWTRNYLADVLRRRDPVKSVSWTMVKELVRRLASADMVVSTGNALQRRMVESERYDLYVVGHEHEAGWWTYGRRKVIRTGALRDEYMLSEQGAVQTPVNKTYLEAWLAGDDVVRSHLVELVAPPRPPETMPANIFDVLPAVRARLAPAETRSEELAAQDEQEAREAHDETADGAGGGGSDGGPPRG